MTTIKAGVIGDPIAQSLSPVIHAHWIKLHGLDATYNAVHIPRGQLVDGLQKLIDQGYSGVNVTLPHKEDVFKLCYDITDTAKAIGAVNVLTFKDGKLLGGNSDAYGFWMHLSQTVKGLGRALPTRAGRFLLLGAGGAARAVIYALKNQGYQNIMIANRTPDKAKALAAEFGVGEVVPWEQRFALIKQVDAVINSTSLGMTGQPFLFVANAIPNLKTDQIAYDLVYKPLKTQLLRGAEPKAAIGIDGLGMLLHQAVPSFQSFFGPNPEVTPELKAEVLSHLQGN